MKYLKKYLAHTLIIFLVLFSLGILYISYKNPNNLNYLKVVFLDVGQGDAIYVEAPNGKQMLIDGGRDINILPKLIRIMPPMDKSIDIVVVTNPDQDHIGGLVEVLKNYQVGVVLEPGTESDTLVYQNLEKEILENKINKQIAHRGMRFILDEEKNIYFDILFPDRDVSTWERNDGSIVGKLVYGEDSFMLMGDATKYTENLIIWNENLKSLKSTVLKLGHHGSDTSSSFLWLEKVKPEIAIISAGKDNHYGHPRQSVIDNLALLKIPYFLTYQEGDIVFETNGKELIYK